MKRSYNKKLGQNFLVNTSLQTKVSMAFENLISRYGDHNILEIGPGYGELSKDLIHYGKKFFMIETDERKFSYIKENIILDGANLILGDAYKMIPTFDTFLSSKFLLVSNLPFYIGSRILVDLALYFPNTPLAFIVQKEVAVKLQTSSKITFFGLWMNLFYDFRIDFDIKPGNFIPSPKVISSHVTGIPKRDLEYILKDLSTRNKMKILLKDLLKSPRKTVFNNLREAGYDIENMIEVFSKNDLDIVKLRIDWKKYESILTILLQLKNPNN
jgi:16S rRNA (adenine1518-N6/adenine1519-N6)-dimethyltransferase